MLITLIRSHAFKYPGCLPSNNECLQMTSTQSIPRTLSMFLCNSCRSAPSGDQEIKKVTAMRPRSGGGLS